MCKAKLVCFDLDDTLIQDFHSVMIPCILNGKESEHVVIQANEECGKLDYMKADYLRAKLLTGLDEQELAEKFLSIAKPLQGIGETIQKLHACGIQCIVITVGPIQVAKIVAGIWGFDSYYGTHYEICDGKFTGEILDYIRSENKVDCLKDYCTKENILASECVAVGDGSTDIPIFEYCKSSIAINASGLAKAKATYSIDTGNLLDVLKFII